MEASSSIDAAPVVNREIDSSPFSSPGEGRG